MKSKNKTISWQNLRYRGLFLMAAIALPGLLVGALINSTQNVHAGVYGAGYYGECAYGAAGTCVGPSGVQNLTLTPGNNSITATWQTPTDDGGSTILGYVVQISDDGGVSWSTAVTTTDLFYAFSGLNPNTTYTIRVAAYNMIDQSAFVDASGRPAFITLSLPAMSPIISIIPGPAARYSSVLYTPTVETNISYSLSMSTDSVDTSLSDGGSNTIAASAGTIGSPITLVADTWGYRIDGAGGFGAGPTTVTNSAASLTGSWAGVPNVLSTDTIATGAATNGQSVDIWFAAGTSTSKTPGAYTQTIVLTAIGS